MGKLEFGKLWGISSQVKNAKILSEELIKLGFDLVSGGTENHLILIVCFL